MGGDPTFFGHSREQTTRFNEGPLPFVNTCFLLGLFYLLIYYTCLYVFNYFFVCSIGISNFGGNNILVFLVRKVMFTKLEITSCNYFEMVKIMSCFKV